MGRLQRLEFGMDKIRKKVVTDEASRPVAVQIDYSDWLEIDALSYGKAAAAYYRPFQPLRSVNPAGGAARLSVPHPSRVALKTVLDANATLYLLGGRVAPSLPAEEYFVSCRFGNGAGLLPLAECFGVGQDTRVFACAARHHGGPALGKDAFKVAFAVNDAQNEHLVGGLEAIEDNIVIYWKAPITGSEVVAPPPQVWVSGKARKESSEAV
jgi:hypothetical protein